MTPCPKFGNFELCTMQSITVQDPQSRNFNPDLVTSGEDNILDQVIESQMFFEYVVWRFKLFRIIQEIHKAVLYNKEHLKLGFSAAIMLMCYFVYY